MDADVVVIGAGVVGLACAQELSARGRDVVLIERHERFGVETSSRNSEVVHAGIYYPAGSLKARLCASGGRSLYAWCQTHGVPHTRLGKLIVATSEEEEPKLDQILRQALENGVTSLQRFALNQIRRIEPHVRATHALWSPDTGIVDSHQLMASLLADAESHGCTVAWRHEVVGAEHLRDGYRVVATSNGETTTLETRCVVNAAGLDADRVAALPGLDVAACRYRLHYARGHYFRVHPRKRHLASHLIYPAPHPTHLGIHVTLDLAGGVRLGPDLQYLESRTQSYDVSESLRPAFHAAVSRYLEGLDEDDLSPDLAGIRPKLQGPGEPFRDFVIQEESARGLPGWVNLVGIESPGLTCCLEIAGLVAQQLLPRPT
ncbi:MAG: NAD(P)/FAD-dependent oxidoreductase [Gemmatimonadales bacterium]